MSRELKEALDILEKEKSISKDTLLEAIEQSLIQACKNHFGKADNVHVTIDPETCDFSSSLRNSDVLRHRMQRTLSCRKSARKNVKCCMMNTMEKKKK